jgi:hypothetical protein
MTVKLDLKPDVEANLTAQARARGVALNDYLNSVIEDLARSGAAGTLAHRNLQATLDAMAEAGRGHPHLSDYAISRESIYSDHD